MISIVANGKSKEIEPGSTVSQFLTTAGLDAARTLVELDGEPLERSRFSETELTAGAHIEVAQMVGGG